MSEALFDMEQPEPFDAEEFHRKIRLANVLREEGMALAEANTDDAWKHTFNLEVARIARSQRYFTSDEVIERVGLPNKGPGARNPVVGALMSRAAKRGLIKRVGYTKSTRPECHGRPIALWVGI